MSDMEVTRGGVEMGVPEELLDDGDLDAVLEQMGGEGMAQPMDAGLVGQTGPAQGAIIDVLCGALADGRLILALGEEPLGGTMNLVPGPQFLKEILAEGNHALTSALGIGDAQLEARGVDVLNPDMSGLGEPESASIDGHEEGPGERVAIGADGEKTLDLVGTEDPWRLGVTSGPFDAGEERLDLTAEMATVEGAERVDGEIDGGSRKLALLDEVE
jgi:hypothetical protein